MTLAHPSGFHWRQTSVMDSTEAHRQAQAERVARLATVDAKGHPHVVPICFVLVDQTLYFAIDAKPKSTTNLKRLRNIAANPAVSILVDHYEEDWSRLWWVRFDGNARVVTEEAEIVRAMDLLVQRYAQYRATMPPGPVVAVSIDTASGWSAA
jgi:PPOX class probable F420-dependent enzyme